MTTAKTGAKARLMAELKDIEKEKWCHVEVKQHAQKLRFMVPILTLRS